MGHYKEARFGRGGAVFFGPMPDVDVLGFLKDDGVSVIWNLTDELQDVFAFEKRMFSDCVNTRIEDFGIPNEDEFLSDLKKVVGMVMEGKRAYVHCLGGHGRTGMAIAALAMVIDGLNAEDGLRFARKNCGGPETEDQKQFVRELHV